MFLRIRDNKRQESGHRHERFRINKERKIAFWLPNKCASTTLKHFLPKHGFVHVDLDETIRAALDPSIQHYAVIRNPYSRAVSAWLEARENRYTKAWFAGTTFREWALQSNIQPDEHWELVTRLVPWKDDWSGPLPEMLRLEDGLNEAMSRILGEQVRLGQNHVRQKVGSDHWKMSYDGNEDVAMEIWTHYLMDFTVGGYDKDSWRL